MSYGTRVQAISQVTDRKPLPSKIPQRLEALWATDVFRRFHRWYSSGRDERLGHVQRGAVLCSRLLSDDQRHRRKTRWFYLRAERRFGDHRIYGQSLSTGGTGRVLLS